ncbi:MAG: hypothetical protein OHK0028_07010 [Deltaproteobacteria bacterium]
MIRIVWRFLAIVLMVAAVPTAGPPLAASPAVDPLVALAKTGGKPLIADFGLGFCMQCRKQAQTLKEIREEYGDKVILRMVNVGKEQALTARYEVELIPTLVFLDASGKVVRKSVGPLGRDEIRKQLSRMGVE